MIEYIIAFIAIISIYDHLTFFLIKRRLKGHFKVQKGMHPFFWKGNKQGVLLIHGFSSSPTEMKGLAKFLKKKGYTIYAPLLPGHGTTPGMLAVTKWQQWVSSCEEAIDVLEDHCKNIFVIGNSMGGNLALLTANKSKKIKGIVTVSTPIFYGPKYRLAKFMLPVMRRIKFLQKKKYSKLFKERIGKKRKDSYNAIPLRSIVHLIKIVKESKKIMKTIKKDILVCQANPDDAMDIKSGEYIYKNVKSRNKKIMWVPNSLHLILLDPLHRKNVYARIFKFIKHGK